MDKIVWKTPEAIGVSRDDAQWASTRKDQRDSIVEETGLFGSSASEGFNSEEERQDKTARHTRNEVPRHAGVTSAGVGTRC